MTDTSDKPKLSQLQAMSELIDVGMTGKAKQSSVSKWSYPDDAQHAVRGVDRDFAFHTDAEDAPWWSLTFEQPQTLNYLVLENRRNRRFRHLADHLTIDVETSAETIRLYDAKHRFGTEHDDSALVLSLTNVPQVTRITITAHTSGGYFHLSRVRALAAGSPTEKTAGQNRNKPLYFITNRPDGFGERLRAVLNAMVAADHCGGKMLMSWRLLKSEQTDFHVINEPEKTFSHSFLKGRLRSNHELSNLSSIEAAKAKFHTDGTLIDKNIDAIIFHQTLISSNSQAPPELGVVSFGVSPICHWTREVFVLV